MADWYRSARDAIVSWSCVARRFLPAAIASTAFLCVGAGSAQALPNGRAYELVSPPDKGDQGIRCCRNPAFRDPLSSPTGDDVVYQARGNFAGSPENHAQGNFYLASRTPTSWSTVSLSPPLDAPQPSVGFIKTWQVSADRSKAVVRSNAALSPGAWSSGNGNLGEPLYLYDLSDGSYQLLTPEPVPGGAGGFTGPTPYSSTYIGANADLSQVLFETTAELTADAVPLDDFGRKLYKWSAGTVTLESVLPAGTPVTGRAASSSIGPNGLLPGVISRDGSRLFFNAIGGPDDGRLFLREGGITVGVNDEENTGQVIAPEAATFRGATPDGSKVFFTSSQQLVDEDPDTSEDLYLYTHSGDPGNDDNLALVSVDGEPDDPVGASVQGVLGISDDGSRAYFVANGQLVDGAEPTCEPPTPTCSSEFAPKLYLWDDGELKFIALLDGGDANMWAPTTVVAYARRYVPPSGAGVMFVSRRPLTGYDSTNPDCTDSDGVCEEIFVYQAHDSTPLSPDLVCVSCDPTGAPPTAGAGNAADQLLSPRARHLSDDARRAFFASPDPLLPSVDTNGKRDVYMWEDGALHLISSGRSDEDSLFSEASSIGDDVFFTTAERLVGWDIDSSPDLYDARVGGGLPEPPNPALPCVGDQCQGSLSGRPLLTDPNSSSFLGRGDLNPGPRPSFSLRRLSDAQRAKLARGRRVLLRVAVNRAGKASATARAMIARRRHVVAKGSRRIGKAGMVRVPLRLSSAARRDLQREGRLRVTVSVRFTGVREARTLRLNLERTGKGQ
jgi:hypothetical protein